MAGSPTRARAMATRCCSPAERVCGRASSFQARPTAASASAGPVAHLAARQGADLEGEGDVLEGAAIGEQLEVLEDDADVAAQVGDRGAAQARDVAAEEQDPPLVGPLGGEDQLEQGALAGARRAGEEDEGALLDGERDVVEGHDFLAPRAEALAHLLEDDHGSGLHPPEGVGKKSARG
jgi:hypothetical protein